MPRYFFDTQDGSSVRDDVGTNLVNHKAAQVEAIRFAGMRLNEIPRELLNNQSFRVDVRNENHEFLFAVITMAVSVLDVELH